jgi:hypothetical protein
MGSRTRGVGQWERVEAIFADPTIYQLGDAIPDPPAEHGGRPRHYPRYMTVAWLAFVAVFRSSRQVEAELADPTTWSRLQRLARHRFPEDPTKWLPDKPMRCHHFLHGRKSLLDPSTGATCFELFEAAAAQLAVELGLCDPAGAGSLTHPTPERTLYGDGKVVTPLYRAKPGEHRLDKETGEIRTLRADHDAQHHVTGGGNPVWGNKFVLWNVRGPAVHQRVVLGVEHVADHGGEAQVAIDMLTRIAPRLPGAQAVLYDGAFRGVHNQHILRSVGLIPVVPVHAQSGGRGSVKPRVEREGYLGPGTVHRVGQAPVTCQLYSVAGALHLGVLDDRGGVIPVPLQRRQTIRRPNVDGTYRWYGEWDVPPSEGGGVVRERLDITEQDRRRGLNRTECLRPIPPSDQDYARLYPRRADAESINRGLDDTHYLTRAHSVGHARQALDLLGFAIRVNALARARGIPGIEQAA